MSEQSATPVEWFQPTGRAMGIFMLTLWAALAVVCIIGGADPAFYGALLVLVMLTHVTLLRPRVGTTRDDLVYRQMYSDLSIPLSDVDSMRIGRYFEATVADHRYVSPAVARSRRSGGTTVARARRAVRGEEVLRDPLSVYADLVEDTTRARVAEAKIRQRAGTPPRAVRRTWARLEIALTVAAVVIFVVLLLI